MPFITPTNLPDKLADPSTVVCLNPDCDLDADVCNHPKLDTDKQNMTNDIELWKTFADGAGDGSLPWNSSGKCATPGSPTFKSLAAWLGMQFTQVYCALQNIYEYVCNRKRVSFVTNGFRTRDEAPDIVLTPGQVYQYTLASNGPIYDDSDSAYNEICNDGDRNLNIDMHISSSPTVYNEASGEIYTVDELRVWDFNTNSWGAWGAWGINSSEWLLTIRTGEGDFVFTIPPNSCLRFQSRTRVQCLSGTATVDKWAYGYSALCVWEEVSI